MAAFTGGRFKEFLKKYGKVALGVHFSVSAASITGLYVAIKNNVDVESILQKVGMSTTGTKDDTHQIPPPTETLDDGFVPEKRPPPSSGDQQTVMVEVEQKKRNRTAELAATSGGALALAVLCNKALFPIRVPITVALTPPIAKFLARRRIVKNSL
ncbi:hypothetical protein L1049_015932 [Liquidambar formosana]|uniref:DUF1279 domain-containing protein n=1 Tax=Liquidambar formosana TaxID=63359 RepID=A0AAP0RYK3_LIQFO